ncbi:His-Xaa-Ser system radical SAM maturase HxsB [Candidatus Woesearchaeota archaeon]|nr:His-Xaa-Ser system radical SAM maturase HxsB [Candidatus Woesearchaeota archaeon]
MSNFDYKVVPYKIKRYDDKFLVISDFGQWIVLNSEDYKKFKFKNLDHELYSKLENSGIIITPGNEANLFTSLTNYKWNISKGPTLHILVPTLRCNQTCKYCYALRVKEDLQGYDMTEETAKQTVDFIFSTPSPIYSIEFTGGEPLLRFDIVKYVVDYATELAKKYSKSVVFSIVTNGLLFDDEKIQYFYDNKVGLCLSLDGPKELHDYHRMKNLPGMPGTYDDVIKIISHLRDIKYPSVNALPVITKKSLSYWKELVDEYVRFNFQALRFKYIGFFGFATGNWKELGYTPEEFLEIWKQVIDYMIDLNAKGIVISEQLATIMLKKILNFENPGYSELDFPCGAVIGQLLYNYDGKIYTCDESRTHEEFAIGHVSTSKLSELLNHDVTKTMISVSNNLSFGCDLCPYYPYCGVCPLENYKSEGTFMVNMPSNYRCKMHKGMFDYIFDRCIHSEKHLKYFKEWVGYRDNQLSTKGCDWSGMEIGKN